jgi:hypothetical protein
MNLITTLWNKLSTNLRVLKEQLDEAKVHIAIDINNGKKKWADKDYLGALHNWTWGVVGETFEHMPRWYLYREALIWVIVISWFMAG